MNILKRFLIPAIVAVLALAACSKDAQEQKAQLADSGNVHALSVEIESGAYQDAGGETKASMEAVIRVKWKEGDEVSVVNATKGKLLGGCLKAKSEGESVVFEGEVKGTINQGDNLYYIYPRVEDNTEEKAFAGYSISLAGQTYDGKKIGDVCFYGYAEDQAGSTDKTISKKIKFSLVTSYAHLNMSNLPNMGSSLSRIDISNVNEGFTWTLSGDALSAGVYTGNNAISVKCSNVNVTMAGNAVARFAIPASDAVANRNITVNRAYTNNYTKDELLASAYYNQLYTIWKSVNVSVDNTKTDKTEVTIDNDNSTDMAEGIISADAFATTTGGTAKPTEISIDGMGTVTFDADATARISTNANGANVLFKLEDVTNTQHVANADIVFEVTMKTLDENGKEVFPKTDGTPGKATISITLDPEVVFVNTITLVEDGAPIEGGVIPGTMSFDLNTHILTFDVEHFSKYAIDYVKEKDFEKVTGVSLNKNTTSLAVGGTETLTATIAPNNATNKKVKWDSSNTAVATVDKDGKVTGVADGTATITVTTDDGAQTATCTVTVRYGTGFEDYEEGGHI